MTAAADGTVFPAYLVKGADATLAADAVRHLVGRLVGDDDPALVVEDLDGDDYEVAAVVDAAQTPPFFGGRRVVVARGIGRFSTQEAAPLVAYLSDPLATTALVLVAGGGQTARSVVDAVRKVGHVVDAGVPSGKARSNWLAARIKEAPVSIDAAATALLADHLGDDMGRLASLLDTLVAAHGPGSRLGPEQVEPFLGQAGGVAPWELTDAIDKGDAATALAVLRRLVGPGGRHPLVVLATLHTHFTRMLRLEGSGLADEREAAAALGITGSTYPAKKAMVQVRRLGYEPLARAISLLADADLALKGAVDWPGEAVLEVLVARLSRLSSRRS